EDVNLSARIHILHLYTELLALGFRVAAAPELQLREPAFLVLRRLVVYLRIDIADAVDSPRAVAVLHCKSDPIESQADAAPCPVKLFVQRQCAVRSCFR